MPVIGSSSRQAVVLLFRHRVSEKKMNMRLVPSLQCAYAHHSPESHQSPTVVGQVFPSAPQSSCHDLREGVPPLRRPFDEAAPRTLKCQPTTNKWSETANSRRGQALTYLRCEHEPLHYRNLSVQDYSQYMHLQSNPLWTH